jgi:hypothetical protein
MVHDLSQDTAPPAKGSSAADSRPRQAVAGLMPPQLGEALIRECWPSVSARGRAPAHLAARVMRTWWLAVWIIPVVLAWALLLLPLFILRLSPFICRRYTLTNRRLMIRKGLRPKPAQEVALADIDDVRVPPESLDPFFRSGDLEIVSKGQVVMKLAGVPEPESFRQAILNAVSAWVPGKPRGLFLPASAVKG